MRKIFIYLVLIWGVTLVLVCFYHPNVEACGQTVLQFDDSSGSYFIEAEDVYETVEELSDGVSLSDGLPVSYFKTSHGTITVVSGKLSKGELYEKALAGARGSFCLMAVMLSIILLFICVFSADAKETVPVVYVD